MKKQINIIIILLIFLMCMGVFSNNLLAKTKDEEICEDKQIKIAIVIDDFGYNAEGTNEMLDLNIPLTAAIIPFEVKSKEIAELALSKGKEIIIHMPMEPNNGSRSALGKFPITVDLGDKDIKERLEAAIGEIKGAKGLNNHMGSKATKDPRVMRSVLNVVKDNNMFFLNSKTSGKTTSQDICRELGIKYYERDVFLDHVSTQENVEKSLEEAYKIAKKKGYAIAIGHVGAQGGKCTVYGIKYKIKNLQSRGVKFVFVSEINN